MAWDDFVGNIFSGSSSDDGWESSEGWDYDFKGKSPDTYNEFVTDYEDNGSLDNDWSSYEGYVPDNLKEKSWTDSFLSPSVIGAAITSGAGLLKGMSDMDLAKQNMQSQKEQQRLNQLLELAKLKYQLLGKGGSSGGSGRRSGGGGGTDPRQAINQQASAQLASGYQNLGGNLASIYGR